MEIITISNKSPKSFFYDIANLHKTELEVGVLAKLGTRFLIQIYRHICRDPECIILAAVDRGKIVGFVCGAENTSQLYWRFLIKRNFLLLQYFIKFFCKPSTWKRMYSLLKYMKVNSNFDLPSAELLSIAIDRNSQNKGLGRKLFAELRKDFDLRGIKIFKTLAACTQTTAMSFYISCGGKLVGTSQLGKDQSYIYIFDSKRTGDKVDSLV